MDRRLDIATDGWGWSNRLGREDLNAIGQISFELVRRWHDWVNRRVETIDVTSDVTVRMQVSIDFRLPSSLPRGLTLGAAEIHMVPLLFLTRDSTLSYFDVRDEQGASLPLLSRHDNGRITGRLLTQAAVLALDARRQDDLALDDALVRKLAAIPQQRRRADSRGMLKQVLDKDPQLFPEPEVGDVLLADAAFRDMLAFCTTSSVIHVPLAYESGRRRIIKLAWDQQWGGASSRERRQRRDLKVRTQTGLTAIGWRPLSRWLPHDHVGGAASHHVQLIVPPEVELTTAQLITREPHAMLPTLVKEAPPAPPADDESSQADPFRRSAPARSERVHLYVHAAQQQRTGFVTIGVRASRQGFLPMSAVIAWVVAVVLFFFWRNAHDIVGRSEVAAALLLIVPALIAGFLIRPQEHAVATRVLRVPRRLTTIVAGIPLLAVAMLVIVSEPEPPRLFGIPIGAASAKVDWKLSASWETGSIAAAVLALMLTVSWLLPRVRETESAGD